ncbi:aldehyde dehydrogenase (NADP(+)) [Maricaulis sp. MIT060901]|uniref:aldehyde dehydrogenase (NADP(+)) n=1 Tax=Maricaulis sp. MIT060901 TaxID=3096993 RepID=UPI003999C049
MINGKHLIAGRWTESDRVFLSRPATGEAHEFSVGTPELVDEACKAAEQAFMTYGYSPVATRAALLNAIADEIETRGDDITRIGHEETGLPEARLIGERGRTVGQLRLFARTIQDGNYLDRRHDEALPERQPVPRPDLKLIQRPIGPVAVFGASNFPLAFSTAGGDTAAALAAGCPVVVKGHSAHPGTADIIAQAIQAAIETVGVHPGVFSQIQGGDRSVGTALVRNEYIRAVGFTGSLAGGRALFDLCAAREDPIPFFGELGSVNPMFLLPEALGARGGAIASGWVASLTMGAGQFCTNPGIAVVVEDDDAEAFIHASLAELMKVQGQTMLTDGIASAYRKGRDGVRRARGVKEILSTDCEAREATPNLFVVSGQDWLADETLSEEVFGPLGLVITVRDTDEMLVIARALKGQLTCTLHMDTADTDLARLLMPVLERKAGRILTNGFPTGVEVSETMVHGGPYPASTNFGATSVGTMSIRRFLRPVCYQNMPRALLPVEWENEAESAVKSVRELLPAETD